MNRKQPVVRPTTANSSAKKVVPPKFVLEKIIGNTATNNACMAINPATNDVAYCAGCVLVIYSPKRNRQSRFLQNKKATKTSLTCVAFSANGKYVAAGESGFEPAIIIWEVATSKVLCEIKNKGHKYGVSCIAFSPDCKYLVSVGHEHDQFIKLWEIPAPGKGADLLAAKKITRKTHDVAFSEDGTYFVTASERMVKYWHIIPRSKKLTQTKSNIDIEGKKCTLNAFQDSTFVSIAVGKSVDKQGSVAYTVTSDGHLCLFSLESRMVDKWVKLKVESAHSISVTSKYVCCGCSDGFIRLFDPSTLAFKATLPKPPPVQSHLIANTNSIAMDNNKNTNKNNHAIAVKLYPDSTKLVAIYRDRSFFVWDISDTRQIAKYRSTLAHSDYIWDISVLPPETDSPLPDGTFATCSSDNTVRLWNVDNDSVVNVSTFRQSIAQKNMFCRDLLHVIKLDESEEAVSPHKEDNGVRCVKFTPDGCYIVTGDRKGALRMHDVFNFTKVWEQSAHDAEILTIDIAHTNHQEQTDEFLLASGGRDRLIHVFNIAADNTSHCNSELVTSLDDHSASITSLKLDQKGEFLISGSADKSVVFRRVTKNNTTGEIKVTREYSNVTHGTIYDIDIDPMQQYVVTAGQDKKLTVWIKEEGRQKRQYKTDVGINANGGEPFKVHIGPGGLYTLISTSDKYICLFDFMSGGCYSRIRGHSELITGLRFTNDCQRLITVSADGCIFIWSVAASLCKAMQERMAELATKKKGAPPPINTNMPQKPVYDDEPPSPPNSARSRVSNDEMKTLSHELLKAHNPFVNTMATSPIEMDYYNPDDEPEWVKRKQQKIDSGTEAQHPQDNLNNMLPEPPNKWRERIPLQYPPFEMDDPDVLYEDEEVEPETPPNTTDEEDPEKVIVFGPDLNESQEFSAEKIEKKEEKTNTSVAEDSDEDEQDVESPTNPTIQIPQSDFFTNYHQGIEKPHTPNVVGRPSISSDFFRKSVMVEPKKVPEQTSEPTQNAPAVPNPNVSASLLGKLQIFKEKQRAKKAANQEQASTQESVQEPSGKMKQMLNRLTKYTENDVDEESQYVPTKDKKQVTDDEQQQNAQKIQQPEEAKAEEKPVEPKGAEEPKTPVKEPVPVKIQEPEEKKDVIEEPIVVQEELDPQKQHVLHGEDDVVVLNQYQFVPEISSPVDIEPTVTSTPRVPSRTVKQSISQTTSKVLKLKTKLTQAFEEMEELMHEGANEEEVQDLRSSVTDLYQSIHNFMTTSTIGSMTQSTTLNPNTNPQFSLTSSIGGQSATVTSDRLDSILEHYSDMLMDKMLQKLDKK